MAVSKFFVSDGIVFGFRNVFTQIRLIILSSLAIIGIVLLSIIGIALLSMPLYSALIQLRDAKGLSDFGDVARVAPHELVTTIAHYWVPLLLALLLVVGLLAWMVTAEVGMSLEVYEKGKSSVGIFFRKLYVVPKMMVVIILWSIPLLFGLLLFVVPGIIWFIRASFVFFIIVDQDAGIFQAFKKSFAITKGYSWPLLGWEIFFCFLNNFAGTCAFFIVFPLCMFSSAHIYRSLMDK